MTLIYPIFLLVPRASTLAPRAMPKESFKQFQPFKPFQSL